jgi:transcriptional regulator with XRE-family HTH domain
MAKQTKMHIPTKAEQLGNRIKALRIKKGFTNSEFFAYEFKINRSQYGKYERGEDMRVSSLFKIIEAHGITVKEFFSEGFDD